jgi:hypothetical protein
VLAEHRDAVIAVAATLLAEETVDGAEVVRIVAEHRGTPRPHLQPGAEP